MTQSSFDINGTTVDRRLIGALLSLHDEYLLQCEKIGVGCLENIPTHDTFFNWLPFAGHEEFQPLVILLDENDYHIISPIKSSLFVGDDLKPVFPRLD